MFNCLIILIFIRPFISSLAFTPANTAYSLLLILCLAIYFLTRKPPLALENKLKTPLLLLCAFLALSTVIAPDMLKACRGLADLLAGILLFAAASSWNAEKRDKAVRLMVFTAFIISLLAVYQYFFSFRHTEEFLNADMSSGFARDYISSRRVFFPFVTPNALAGYIAMLIPLSLADKQRRWLAIPLALAFFLSRSLGAFASVFAAVLLYFLIQGKIDKRKIICLSSILLAAGLIFILRAGWSPKHHQPLFSTVMRLDYWGKTLDIIRLHPFIGCGLANFNLAASRYSHNSYLQFWAETGIPGLACLFWLAGTVVFTGIKKLKEKISSPGDGLLFIAAITFLLHNLVDFTFFLPEVSQTWWLILGIFYASSRK